MNTRESDIPSVVMFTAESYLSDFERHTSPSERARAADVVRMYRLMMSEIAARRNADRPMLAAMSASIMQGLLAGTNTLEDCDDRLLVTEDAIVTAARKLLAAVDRSS